MVGGVVSVLLCLCVVCVVLWFSGSVLVCVCGCVCACVLVCGVCVGVFVCVFVCVNGLTIEAIPPVFQTCTLQNHKITKNFFERGTLPKFYIVQELFLFC